MRNRYCLGLLVLLAMALGWGTAFAVSPDKMRTQEELRAWYGKIIDSYNRKDVGGYMALYTQDAKIRDFQGNTKDRKALEAMVKEDMAGAGKIHSADFEIHKLTLKGRDATVVCTETWKYVLTDLKGQFGPEGNSYDVVWRSPAEVKFLKTADGWLGKYRKATGPETLTVEGKPLVAIGAPSKAIADVKLFAELTQAETHELESAAVLRRGRAGERIIEQGKRSGKMFIAMGGRADVRFNGKHIVTLSGQSLFGEIEFLDGLPASADVVLLEETDLIELDYGALNALMEKNPRLGYVIIRGIAEIEALRLRNSNQKRECVRKRHLTE